MAVMASMKHCEPVRSRWNEFIITCGRFLKENASFCWDVLSLSMLRQFQCSLCFCCFDLWIIASLSLTLSPYSRINELLGFPMRFLNEFCFKQQKLPKWNIVHLLIEITFLPAHNYMLRFSCHEQQNNFHLTRFAIKWRPKFCFVCRKASNISF